MEQRTIGDRQVSALGLGGMLMSIEGRPDRERSVATVHAALDAGITLIDTADSYLRDPGEVGHNETLIAGALTSYGSDTSHVLVATKGGHVRPGDGSWTVNGDPEYLKYAAQESAKRLGVDSLGLYQFHRPDPEVPYDESVGALAELLDEGVIQMAGISNADTAQMETAQQVLGGRLAAVQNQFSPAFITSLEELRLCEQWGIAFLPWSPLGGIANATQVGQRHPEFQALAEDKHVTPQRLALAWMLRLSDVVIPIPGASRPDSVADSAAAVEVDIADDEVEMLTQSLLEASEERKQRAEDSQSRR